MNDLKNKVYGSYFGSILGDALGGPTEGMHADRIREVYGWVDDLIPYSLKPAPRPSGNFRTTAGSITDDTRGKNMVSLAYVEKQSRCTADDVAKVLWREIIPEEWSSTFPGRVYPFFRMHYFGVDPRDCGYHNVPHGGAGWWTSIGLVNACNPRQAAMDAIDIVSMFKRGTDRELTCAFAAATAEAFRPTATVDSVIEAAVTYIGDEARHLIERAVSVAKDTPSVKELIPRLYECCLIPRDKVFPKAGTSQFIKKPPLDPRFGTPVGTNNLSEQVPIAMAMFCCAKGQIVDTLLGSINFGRDCDSFGTIAGAIAGAFSGFEAIPQRWVDTVIEVNDEWDFKSIATGLLVATQNTYAELKRTCDDLKTISS